MRSHNRFERHGNILERLMSVDNQRENHNKHAAVGTAGTPYGEAVTAVGQQATDGPLDLMNC